MQNCFRNTVVFLFIFLLACSSKDDGAQVRLDSAHRFYANGEYELAKQEIDSIKILYPKSFDEIRAGLAFLDTIRRAENEYIISICDSLILINSPEVEKIKSLFIFEKNKEYQESGSYIPKRIFTGGVIAVTGLRSGVGEDGILYIESVSVGARRKHNKIKVTAKDGSFVETLPVNDEGLNYKFSNMGKDYEIVRFSGMSENGVARFIFANKEKPLTVTLEGGAKYTYTLSQTIKSAISESYQLSTMMLQLDSLKTAREKAGFHLYYLDNKGSGGMDGISK